MAAIPSPAPRLGLLEHAQHDLSALVLNIEFTIISVMAGMILFLLADNATPMLRDLRFEYWPYGLACLLIILWVWTEVMGHALIFIGWPLDLNHNLLYLTSALALGIAEHFLTDPQGWFATLLLSVITNGAVMLYDYRMLQEQREKASARGHELYVGALKRQRQLVLTIPLNVGMTLTAILSIRVWPEFFLSQHGHLIWVLSFDLWMIVLLVRGLFNFAALRNGMVYRSVEEAAALERDCPANVLEEELRDAHKQLGLEAGPAVREKDAPFAQTLT